MIREPQIKVFEKQPDYTHTIKTRQIGFTCKLCGERERCGWTPETNERLITNQICKNCDLWARTVAQDELNPIWYGKLIIDGKRYTAKPLPNCEAGETPIIVLENLATGERKPFCKLKIEGVVPKFFLKMFPDNARIVTDDPEFPLANGNC